MGSISRILDSSAPARANSMTLTEIRNEILYILTQKDTITEADFSAVRLDDDVAHLRASLIPTVLKDLAEAGILRHLPAPQTEPPMGAESLGTWVLTAPLGVAGQDVHLSLPTSIHIADEINAFRDAYGMEGEWPPADSLNLGEAQILMLLGIIGELRSDPDGDGGAGDDERFGSGDRN